MSVISGETKKSAFLTAASLLLSGCLVAVSTLIYAPSPGEAQPSQDNYLLDSQDQVRLKVFEWRPSRDEIYEWKALNDTYVIGPDGRISLPIVGEVKAAGTSTAELSRAIGQLMKSQIGLVEVPNISVEVVKFRPFYIMGRITNPGEYAFRPDLTVLQAVSIAGGYYRSRQTGDSRLDREAIVGKGDLDLLSLQRGDLLAKRARIQADLSGAANINFPAELSKDRPSDLMQMQEEASILGSLREAFKAQLEPLQHIKVELESEADSIRNQLQTHQAQVALAQEELGKIQDLAQRRLTADTRRIEAQRNVYALDQDHMRLDQSLVRVKQDISKTDLSISELKSKRLNDLTLELRDTQSKLDEATRKFDTTKRLLFDTALEDATDETSQTVTPVYKIVRKQSGQSIEMTADENTLVQPGDTIKVQINPSAVPLARATPAPDSGEGKFAPTEKRQDEPNPFSASPIPMRGTSARNS
jgi:polysaccharide export outer membrane protein/exopolysaccharide production protein ExoF